MTSFPEPLRIPSKVRMIHFHSIRNRAGLMEANWVCYRAQREIRNLIMIVYWSKLRDDARRVTTVLDEKSLAAYLYDYLVKEYALTHMADVQVRQE